MTAFCGFGCSFAAKWFGGYARGNRGTNYAASASRSLLKHLPYIATAQFKFCSYKDLEPVDSLIYCDPPYQNTTSYGAVEPFDHDEFWEVMRVWSKRNTVIVSEYQAPDDFVCVQEFQSRIGLRNKAKEHEVRSEKVFAHKSIAHQIVC